MWAIFIPAGLSLAVAGLVAWRRLALRVPFFLFLLLVQLAQMVALSGKRYGSADYFYAWARGERVLLLGITFSALEIYFHFNRALFRSGRTGAILLVGAFLVGLTAAQATAHSSSAEWTKVMSGLLAAKRAWLSAISVGLAGVFWFYRRFDVPVASYVWPHGWLFLCYVASQATGIWLAEASGSRWLGVINQALSMVWIACLSGWLWLFSRVAAYPPAPTLAELEAADQRARRLDELMNDQ